jgi:hypothetical protein
MKRKNEWIDFVKKRMKEKRENRNFDKVDRIHMKQMLNEVAFEWKFIERFNNIEKNWVDWEWRQPLKEIKIQCLFGRKLIKQENYDVVFDFDLEL